MALADKIQAMRDAALAAGKPPVPDEFQGVDKDRIRTVLGTVARATDNIVDAVFALLDDVNDSWFTTAPPGTKFCAGATTAHVGSHIGILQHGTVKRDREGRDYWIKPLVEIGAVVLVYLDPKSRTFLVGHPKSKSPNSGYRLEASFVQLLQARDADLATWIGDDAKRARLAVQAEQAEETRKLVVDDHGELIAACVDVYAAKFLPGFVVLFVDDSDGQRVTDEESEELAAAGLSIKLGDAMPDVLLWNPTTDALWVIEAVTSDGEVDTKKVEKMQEFATRNGKPSVGFTTAYPTWKLAAQRQGRHKNIADGTFVWIREDASKHWKAEAFAV